MFIECCASQSSGEIAGRLPVRRSSWPEQMVVSSVQHQDWDAHTWSEIDLIDLGERLLKVESTDVKDRHTQPVLHGGKQCAQGRPPAKAVLHQFVFVNVRAGL